MQPDILEQLKVSGLRVTRGRIAIVHALQRFQRPVSLDEVEASDLPDLGDRATVFRNLRALSKAGIVRRLHGVGRRDLYEAKASGDGARLHPHAVCVDCGATRCVEVAVPRPKAVAVKGWTGLEPSLTYWGHCADCHGDEQA